MINTGVNEHHTYHTDRSQGFITNVVFMELVRLSFNRGICMRQSKIGGNRKLISYQNVIRLFN